MNNPYMNGENKNATRAQIWFRGRRDGQEETRTYNGRRYTSPAAQIAYAQGWASVSRES